MIQGSGGDRDAAVAGLANVFKGGRISGWVVRNRSFLTGGDFRNVELELLLELSPTFSVKVSGLPRAKVIVLVKEALVLADKSPLSATTLAM